MMITDAKHPFMCSFAILIFFLDEMSIRFFLHIKYSGSFIFLLNVGGSLFTPDACPQSDMCFASIFFPSVWLVFYSLNSDF